MPRAVEFAHFGRESELTIEGPLPARDSYAFGVDANTDEIIRFYDRELARLDWAQDTYAIFMGGGEIDVWGWCRRDRRDRLVRLAILDPRSPYDRGLFEGNRYRTVFRIDLIGRDSSVPCPYRSR